MMQSAKAGALEAEDFSTSKGLAHHFWKWLSECDQSKDTQDQRFYSWT